MKSQPEVTKRLIGAFYKFAIAQPDPPLYIINPKMKRPSAYEQKPKNEKKMSDDMKKKLRTLGYLD